MGYRRRESTGLYIHLYNRPSLLNRCESVDLMVCFIGKGGIWRAKPPNPREASAFETATSKVWAALALICFTRDSARRLPLLGFSCVVQANHARRKNFTGDKRQTGFGVNIFENRNTDPNQNWIYIEPEIIN